MWGIETQTFNRNRLRESFDKNIIRNGFIIKNWNNLRNKNIRDEMVSAFVKSEFTTGDI